MDLELLSIIRLQDVNNEFNTFNSIAQILKLVNAFMMNLFKLTNRSVIYLLKKLKIVLLLFSHTIA